MPPLSIRILAAALATLALAGCGSSAPGPAHATLVLDFVPNAVHAGIYRALAAGYYRAAGIDLQVIPPSSTSTTLELVAAGKAQLDRKSTRLNSSHLVISYAVF